MIAFVAWSLSLPCPAFLPQPPPKRKTTEFAKNKQFPHVMLGQSAAVSEANGNHVALSSNPR